MSVRELEANSQRVEVLARPVREDMLRRGIPVHVRDQVVELQLDVVVQVPVDAERHDTLIAAIDAGLLRGGTREEVMPVQVGIAVTRGEFPRAPRIAVEGERR